MAARISPGTQSFSVPWPQPLPPTRLPRVPPEEDRTFCLGASQACI